MFSLLLLVSRTGEGHSITEHTRGLARRSDSKTPISKNSNIIKMLESYPLNILKVQPKSSKSSNLGQIFIFTENCTPNYPYESFSYPLTIVQINIFEEPQNIFSQSKSQPPNYRASRPVLLTIECPSLGVSRQTYCSKQAAPDDWSYVRILVA